MRRLAVTVALATLALTASADGKKKAAPSHIPEGYKWETNFDAAKTRAAAEGRIFYLAFSTEWCGHCKIMVAKTYPDSGVKSFLEPMVLMMVNPDESKESKKLQDDFKVDGYPTMILMKPDGTEIHRVAGGLETPEDFLGEWTTSYWNDYANASNAKDMKKSAEGLFMLITWFGGTAKGKEAVEAKKQWDANEEFKKAWAELEADNERTTLAAKAPAALKLGRKEDAKAAYKTLAEKYKGTKEGDEAIAVCKKMSIKLDAPPAR